MNTPSHSAFSVLARILTLSRSGGPSGELLCESPSFTLMGLLSSRLFFEASSPLSFPLCLRDPPSLPLFRDYLASSWFVGNPGRHLDLADDPPPVSPALESISKIFDGLRRVLFAPPLPFYLVLSPSGRGCAREVSFRSTHFNFRLSSPDPML